MECEFECGLTFERVSVNGGFGFEHSKFNSNVSFRSSTFNSEVTIMWMTIFVDLNLKYTKFKDHIAFTDEFPQII